MAATEKQIQEAIQTILLTITGTFSAGDVVINDPRVLDGETANAPYAIIQNSSTFPSMQQTVTPTGIYNIPVTLAVRFDDWATGANAFRDARQAIFDKFNEVDSANRMLGGAIGSLTLNTIRPDGEIGKITADNTIGGLPIFLVQDLIFEVEIWG